MVIQSCNRVIINFFRMLLYLSMLSISFVFFQFDSIYNYSIDEYGTYSFTLQSRRMCISCTEGLKFKFLKILVDYGS